MTVRVDSFLGTISIPPDKKTRLASESFLEDFFFRREATLSELASFRGRIQHYSAGLPYAPGTPGLNWTGLNSCTFVKLKKGQCVRGDDSNLAKLNQPIDRNPRVLIQSIGFYFCISVNFFCSSVKRIIQLGVFFNSGELFSLNLS